MTATKRSALRQAAKERRMERTAATRPDPPATTVVVPNVEGVFWPVFASASWAHRREPRLDAYVMPVETWPMLDEIVRLRDEDEQHWKVRGALLNKNAELSVRCATLEAKIAAWAVENAAKVPHQQH